MGLISSLGVEKKKRRRKKRKRRNEKRKETKGRGKLGLKGPKNTISG